MGNWFTGMFKHRQTARPAQEPTRAVDAKAARAEAVAAWEAAQAAEWAARVEAAHQAWLAQIERNGGVDGAGFTSAGEVPIITVDTESWRDLFGTLRGSRRLGDW